MTMRHVSALAFVLMCSVAAPASELDALRNDYAMHYLDAKAHLRLAQYLAAHDDRLTAFFISENARRNEFPQEVFEQAFREVFRNDHFDNSKAAETRLLNEVAKAPEDTHTRMLLADVYASRSDWRKARSQAEAALKVAPDDFNIVMFLSEVFRSEDREAEGARFVSQWMAAHADSREAWIERTDKAVREKAHDAEAVCRKGIEKFPEEAMLHFNLARALHESGQVAPAAAEYERASALDPKSAYINGWTGRFFLKAMNDRDRSLRYYLNAYFEDPEFYDTEYAEGRIRTVAYERAQARFAADRGAGVSLTELMRSADPVLAGLAVKEASSSWNDAMIPALVEVLARDDSNLRYAAADALGRHAGETFDDRLRTLLAASDLRVRGAAAYIAGARWKTDVVPMLKPWLSEPAELIRYDAISVLAESGGEPGKKVLRELRDSGSVREPRLVAILKNLDH